MFNNRLRLLQNIYCFLHFKFSEIKQKQHQRWPTIAMRTELFRRFRRRKVRSVGGREVTTAHRRRPEEDSSFPASTMRPRPREGSR